VEIINIISGEFSADEPLQGIAGQEGFR